MYYGTSYFQQQDSPLPDAFILQVITNVVNVVSTFPGLYAIDKLGRRPILLIGALGMGICQYVVGACGVATSLTNGSSAQAQFAFICIYIFFFASTFGPAAWVVTGEIFPLKVRAKCLSMATASNCMKISIIQPLFLQTSADHIQGFSTGFSRLSFRICSTQREQTSAATFSGSGVGSAGSPLSSCTFSYTRPRLCHLSMSTSFMRAALQHARASSIGPRSK